MFLLCAIDIFSKYVRVASLKDKKSITIVDAFQSILSNSKGKPNKICVGQCIWFRNSSFKKWLKQNSADFDVVNNVLVKYDDTYHTTIKMKPIYVKSNSHVKHNVDSNGKDSKFKIGDHVRFSKYKNIFAKGYAPNWSEEVLVISKIKDTAPRTYVILYLNSEEIVGTCYEKEL